MRPLWPVLERGKVPEKRAGVPGKAYRWNPELIGWFRGVGSECWPISAGCRSAFISPCIVEIVQNEYEWEGDMLSKRGSFQLRCANPFRCCGCGHKARSLCASNRSGVPMKAQLWPLLSADP